MTEERKNPFGSSDPAELNKVWMDIADRAQHLVQDFVQRQSGGVDETPDMQELNVLMKPFQTFAERLSQHPQNFLVAQAQFWQDTLSLWQRTAMKASGMDVGPVVEPGRGDRRFRDEEWSDNPVFDFIKQSYLLASRFVGEALPEAEGPQDKRAAQVEFQARQFVDAMSPTNFAALNPTVLRETMDSGGQNLLNGLRHMLEDLEAGKGQLRTKMTDPDAFEVGVNVGTSQGKVIFENDLIQLIHYEPSTKRVFSRPLVILPPWINKFYILDLQPKNSFIKWAVDQGHSVFVVSWVNPDAELADKTFDNYLTEGALAAIDAACEASGQSEVNLVGYCLGGTLLACTLAYMAATGDDRAKSATYFASLADFENPGDLGVFIDEDQIDVLEKKMEQDGYLDGSAMATTFNSLRANDLIWSFVINNYLMGKEPMPFDLLYWNSDSTRMPSAMHSFYLREMYLHNRLREPGGLQLNGVSIDLGQIKTPTYIVTTVEDHIAPWRSCYSSTQLYGGPVRFILGGSGHIAGIINPPAANKYGYKTNEDLPAGPEEWLSNAAEHEGSWWTDWQSWMEGHGDKKVNAKKPGRGPLKAIEDAPGRYVLVRGAA